MIIVEAWYKENEHRLCAQGILQANSTKQGNTKGNQRSEKYKSVQFRYLLFPMNNKYF